MKDRSLPVRAAALRRVALLGALALAACGGGGGGGGGGAGHAVSGTLGVSANLVVDSDTNDPNQARVANDQPPSAHPHTPGPGAVAGLRWPDQ